MEQEIVWKYWNVKTFQQIKTSYDSGTKIFEQRFTAIYRHLPSYCCENFVLDHSGNGAVQMFFVAPTRNMFLAVSRENNFYKVDCVEVSKMSEVFWEKLYCKMDDLFC